MVCDAIDETEGALRGCSHSGDDVEIYALHARGWSVAAISRHTGRDRKTVARYLKGNGPGQQRVPAASYLEPFRDDIGARFVEDPHLPAVTLLDETRGGSPPSPPPFWTASSTTPRFWQLPATATACVVTAMPSMPCDPPSLGGPGVGTFVLTTGEFS